MPVPNAEISALNFIVGQDFIQARALGVRILPRRGELPGSGDRALFGAAAAESPSTMYNSVFADRARAICQLAGQGQLSNADLRITRSRLTAASRARAE